MQKQTSNGKSNLPLVIIGLVLVAAIVGGYYFYSASKTTPTANKANTNSAPGKTPNNAAGIPPGTPPGASPANTLGAPTAAVRIEEFADYQCPTCASMHKTMKEINSLYSGRIQFTYRNFPLTQIHKNAYEAAVAAEAAGQQGKLWAMQDQLFTNQQAWSNSNEARKIFEEYAQKIGLDIPKFQTDMAGLVTKTRVDADLARARAIPVGSTPTVFINDRKLNLEQMNINAMRQIIDAELQKSGSQPAQPASQVPATAPANQPAANSNASNKPPVNNK